MGCVSQLHRFVDRRMVGDAIEEQDLIKGQAQQDSDGREYLLRLDRAQLIDMPIQSPLPAHHPIDQFGEQGSLALIQMRMAFQHGPDQTVRMGEVLFGMEEQLISQCAGIDHESLASMNTRQGGRA